MKKMIEENPGFLIFTVGIIIILIVGICIGVTDNKVWNDGKCKCGGE